MTTIKKQLAALPYIVAQNRPTILLVTSRKSVNWIIPKGWPKEGMPDRELVALEAYEEAGLSGTVGHNPVGLYTHPVGTKRDSSNTAVLKYIHFLWNITMLTGQKKDSENIPGWIEMWRQNL